MGGPKAYPWEASVDTPRLPPFRQDCVRRNRDQRLQRGQGADASRRPVPVMDRKLSDLACRRCQEPEDENFRTKVGHKK